MEDMTPTDKIIQGLERENKILRALLIEKMLQDGFTLKSTTMHQLKDKAEKLRIEPKLVIEIAESVFAEALKRIFQSK